MLLNSIGLPGNLNFESISLLLLMFDIDFWEINWPVSELKIDSDKKGEERTREWFRLFFGGIIERLFVNVDSFWFSLEKFNKGTVWVEGGFVLGFSKLFCLEKFSFCKAWLLLLLLIIFFWDSLLLLFILFRFLLFKWI